MARRVKPRRVTTRELLALLTQAVERLSGLERLIADRLEPLANANRYELGRRLAVLELRVSDLETWAESWNGDDSGDEWKQQGAG